MRTVGELVAELLKPLGRSCPPSYPDRLTAAIEARDGERNHEAHLEADEIRAERDAALAALSVAREALDLCIKAMAMQAGREDETLHIPQPTAKLIWDEAHAKGYAALTRISELVPS